MKSLLLCFMLGFVFFNSAYADHTLEIRVTNLEQDVALLKQQVAYLNQFLEPPTTEVIGIIQYKAKAYNVSNDCSNISESGFYWPKGGKIVKILKRINCKDDKFIVVRTMVNDIATFKLQNVTLFDNN